MVKSKVTNPRKFTERSQNRLSRLVWLLPVFAFGTFVASWSAAFPQRLVERWYARGAFPLISSVAEKIADAVAFSWFDVALPIGVALTVIVVYRRRWRYLLFLVSACYVLFFWTWAINYHRQPLASKLEMDSARTQPDALEKFTSRSAGEINRLYSEKHKAPLDDLSLRAEADRRVRHVVQIIDGTDWEAAHRIKISRLADPWFHAAGIDGMFNPVGQEPVISNSVLDIERPFVICHELAHVRGYPDEGDANVIAAFATLMSEHSDFRYSGWLSLWLYLRNRDSDKLLEPGPRSDLDRIFARARAEQIGWINDLQRVALDWFLKANHVEQGVRSYSRVVLMAASTEPYWDRFR
jgi:hypothetical protein